LNTFYQNLKGKVFIDYTHLKQSSAPTKTTTSVNQKPSAKLPEGYSEQLILKRYSPNTIKTYSSCFLKFILFLKNQRPWVEAADYWGVYFDMNEKVYKIFDKEGLNIPYPQMDVHVHKNS